MDYFINFFENYKSFIFCFLGLVFGFYFVKIALRSFFMDSLTSYKSDSDDLKRSVVLLNGEPFIEKEK